MVTETSAELDSDIQALVTGTPNAVVLLDPNSGRVIAMGNPDVACGEAYAIGSVAKLVTVGVGLRDGVFDPDRTEICTGSFTAASGRTVPCWIRRGHGKLDLRGALVHSCNVYVLRASRQLTFRQLRGGFVESGFGRGTGIDRPSENPGAVPNSIPEDGLGLLAIGQSPELRATPLQLCVLAAALGNGGEIARPWLNEPSRTARGSLPFPEHVLSFLRSAMRAALVEGTCMGLQTKDGDVAAKTGTASWPEGYHTHGWCIGFAPYDDPEVAFCAFVFNGTGAQDAVPLAKTALDLWADAR